MAHRVDACGASCHLAQRGARRTKLRLMLLKRIRRRCGRDQTYGTSNHCIIIALQKKKLGKTETNAWFRKSSNNEEKFISLPVSVRLLPKGLTLLLKLRVTADGAVRLQATTNTLLGLFMREIFLNARPPSVSSDMRRRSLRGCPSPQTAIWKSRPRKAVCGEGGTSGLL